MRTATIDQADVLHEVMTRMHYPPNDVFAPMDDGGASVCMRCGAEPNTFGTNNLARAHCETPGCPGGVYGSPAAFKARAPLDLPAIVADMMALCPDASRDELEAAIIAGVEATRGKLRTIDRAKVGVEVGCAFNRRDNALEQAGVSRFARALETSPCDGGER